MTTTWHELKSAIQAKIPAHSFKMWIEPMTSIGFDGTELKLACPNRFSRQRVLEHYGELIRAELSRSWGKSCRLSISIADAATDGPPQPRPAAAQQLPLPSLSLCPHTGRLFRRDFTFDQFVVGSNSDFAYSAALSLASRKVAHQNALFLLSQTGMGKSHLSQAIGHHILSQFPGERVYYITAEDFTNEMIYALRNGSIDQFKQKYRTQCDVLLLEDIHFISGKERTQSELALTLDALFEAEKKLIFTSFYLPGDIPKVHDKLRSRLASGLISTIDPPNFKTRVRILEKKAAVNGYGIPQEVMQYLAGELVENVRQLESGLLGVAAKSDLLGRPVDLKLAEGVVQTIARRKTTITLDVIKKMVCKYYGISVDDIVSRFRKQSIVRPRQIAIYLAKQYTQEPLQAIGKCFNRYHATAMHAIKAVTQRIDTCAAMQKQVAYLRQKLDSGQF